MDVMEKAANEKRLIDANELKKCAEKVCFPKSRTAAIFTRSEFPKLTLRRPLTPNLCDLRRIGISKRLTVEVLFFLGSVINVTDCPEMTIHTVRTVVKG